MKSALVVLAFAAMSLVFSTCVRQAGVVPDSPQEKYEEVTSKAPDARLYTEPPKKPDTKARYIFYLHGRIVEEKGADNAVDPEFGKYEYYDILDAFADRGFIVISEVRAKDTDIRQYAAKIVHQIVDLLNADVPPGNITVVGASKGGAITLRVSSLLANKKINYVLLSSCGKDYLDGAQPDLVGNVLSVYDYKDTRGAGTCKDIFAASKNLQQHKEIELKLGIGHAILYKPMEEWLEPTVAWAGGDYN